MKKLKKQLDNLEEKVEKGKCTVFVYRAVEYIIYDLCDGINGYTVCEDVMNFFKKDGRFEIKYDEVLWIIKLKPGESLIK